MFEDLTYKDNKQIPLYNQNDFIASKFIDNQTSDIDSFQSYTISQSNLQCYSPALFDMYFSQENIQNLQNRLRYGVYLRSNKRFIIPEQSIRELGIIMESMYYQYSKKPSNHALFKKEIEYLNTLVLEYAIPNTLSAVEAQNNYLNFISKDVVPQYEYEYTSNKGLKTKLYNPGFD